MMSITFSIKNKRYVCPLLNQINMEAVLDVLDVTVIEPRLKHPTIFEKFDSLQSGEAFIIYNDHDPLGRTAFGYA